MSGISTHILDLTSGRPAAGVVVWLARAESDEWADLSRRETGPDGRVKSMLRDYETLQSGKYRLRFETATYFEARGVAAFHPIVDIVFEVRNASEHYHVPLLLTPHSYSTYRGS